MYALHAPEVECIGKGKARKPYEFGVKSALVVSHQHGLMLGACTFPGYPYDGHILAAVLEQATNLTQDLGLKLKHIVVDLGFRGVDADNPDKQIIHRGKYKRLSAKQKGWLRRRPAIEPAIGHLKSDHRMDRCWLKGSIGDALHSISCAAGYNLRWLLRAIARLGIGAVFVCLLQAVLSARRAIGTPNGTPGLRRRDWFNTATIAKKMDFWSGRVRWLWQMNFAGATTYVPLARGFVYLTAVVDVASRKVLAHKVAITLEACHAREILEEAFARYGTPEIVSTDQGSQFTAIEFTDVVLAKGCKLSMDGRGAWRDNVFVERVWRSVKYERVYLKPYDNASAARADIAQYLDWYNTNRPHSSLDGFTPEQMYLELLPKLAKAA